MPSHYTREELEAMRTEAFIRGYVEAEVKNLGKVRLFHPTVEERSAVRKALTEEYTKKPPLIT